MASKGYRLGDRRLRQSVSQVALRASVIAGVLAGTTSALSEVYDFDSGAQLSVNVTTTYQAGIRAEDASPRSFSPDTDAAYIVLVPQVPFLQPYYQSTNTPRSYNFDDPNRNFEKGDFFTNGFSALAEANFKYEDYGFKLSGNGYYDFVYHMANSNEVDYPDGINKRGGAADHFPGQTRYANGGRFRLLDAFAYGTFDVFDTSLSVRVGNQVVAWGESLFFGNISLSQAVVDTTRANTPGAEVKDILLPIPQASVNWGLTDRLSVVAYYQPDWDYNQLDGVGSYFSRADLIGPGSEFAYGSTNPFPDIIGHYANACTLSASIPECTQLGLPAQVSQILSDIISNNLAGIGDPATGRFDINYMGEKKPNNTGQFGVGFTYAVTDGLNTGFYFLKYHEKNPLPVFDISHVQTDPTRASTVGSALIQACGVLGICGNLEQQIADGADAVVAVMAPLYLPYNYVAKYFEDVKLYGASASTSIGPINFGFDFAYRQDAPMLVDGNISGITAPQPVLGDVIQANLNGLYVGGASDFWDSITVVFEVSYNRVIDHETLYLYDVNGQPLKDGQGNNINKFDELTNDTSSWGYQGIVELGYTDIFPGGWDMSVPIIFGQAIGTPAYNGSLGALTGNGDVRLASGVKFRYLNNLELSVMYSAFLGSYHRTERPLADRDYVVATVKYTF
ncbi:DUF1302 family protein [Oleomonas cavernae]|uniref:DUF1302 family protein n=1 Tax=Oleomonas cavernae TaxID=2320859 RepID=A0A418WE43_9PROT|nr:DUF1302 family protein [Oleomonas cavernae]RJF88278.1 DUF1302 family protein [Oleomonas cavernae]